MPGLTAPSLLSKSPPKVTLDLVRIRALVPGASQGAVIGIDLILKAKDDNQKRNIEYDHPRSEPDDSV